MTEVAEIIDYIRSLQKKFNHQLFITKINDLAYLAEFGLEYPNFHTLVKLWLNLSIPLRKWILLGKCLVPKDSIKETTVVYILSWLLSSYRKRLLDSKVRFVLQWFTAAMDNKCIDREVLYLGYDVFYSGLTYENFAPYVIKLLYNLTKPWDITRSRVLEVLQLAKSRAGMKAKYTQLMVLLGLFKSFKPECVPENVQAIPVLEAFKKIDPTLNDRFKKKKMEQKALHNGKTFWVYQDNKIEVQSSPLLPKAEYNLPKSSFVEEALKNLENIDSKSVLKYKSLDWTRPERLRSLLSSDIGFLLMGLASKEEQEFLSIDLMFILNTSFFEVSIYSYEEKRYLLCQLALFQNTLMQGIPVVTKFLAQYIRIWNETDYFDEILDLVQWVSVTSPVDVKKIVESLTKIYHRAELKVQSTILNSLNTMYSNLIYNSTRRKTFFIDAISTDKYSTVLPHVATTITRMCNKALQVNPDNMWILHSTVSSMVIRARRIRVVTAVIRYEPISLLSLLLPFFSFSIYLVDKISEGWMWYIRIVKAMTASNTDIKKNIQHEEQLDILKGFVYDLINWCYKVQPLVNMQRGLLFSIVRPELLLKLRSLLFRRETRLSLKHEVAFIKGAYIKLNSSNMENVNYEQLMNVFVDDRCPHTSAIIKRFVKE